MLENFNKILYYKTSKIFINSIQLKDFRNNIQLLSLPSAFSCSRPSTNSTYIIGQNSRWSKRHVVKMALVKTACPLKQSGQKQRE